MTEEMESAPVSVLDMTLQQSVDYYLQMIYGNFGVGRWGTEYASFYWGHLSSTIQQAGDATFFQNNVSQTAREQWYRAYYEVRLPAIIKDDKERLNRPTEPCPGFYSGARAQLEEVQIRIDEWVAAGKPNRILESHKREDRGTEND